MPFFYFQQPLSDDDGRDYNQVLYFICFQCEMCVVKFSFLCTCTIASFKKSQLKIEKHKVLTYIEHKIFSSRKQLARTVTKASPL